MQRIIYQPDSLCLVCQNASSQVSSVYHDKAQRDVGSLLRKLPVAASARNWPVPSTGSAVMGGPWARSGPSPCPCWQAYCTAPHRTHPTTTPRNILCWDNMFCLFAKEYIWSKISGLICLHIFVVDSTVSVFSRSLTHYA